MTMPSEFSRLYVSGDLSIEWEFISCFENSEELFYLFVRGANDADLGANWS